MAVAGASCSVFVAGQRVMVAGVMGAVGMGVFSRLASRRTGLAARLRLGRLLRKAPRRSPRGGAGDPRRIAHVRGSAGVGPGSGQAAPVRAPHGSVIRVGDPRQRLELVEGRRRGQRPFERGRALAPRVVGRLLLADEGIDDAARRRSPGRRRRCRSRSRRRSASRRRRPDSRHSGAACRRARGSASGRRARSRR